MRLGRVSRLHPLLNRQDFQIVPFLDLSLDLPDERCQVQRILLSALAIAFMASHTKM